MEIDLSNSVNERVGRKIRQLRWKNGVTQRVLAERISVPVEDLEQIELGVTRASADILWALASEFDTRVGDFFPLMGDEDPDTVATVAKIADALMDRQATSPACVPKKPRPESPVRLTVISNIKGKKA